MGISGMKCISETFEPGWLMRQCHAAHIRCMADHSPWFFECAGQKAKRPIPESEAQEVFAIMDARFREWTGKSLAEHIAVSHL